MATKHTLTRKNGKPVKRFWQSKITQKARTESYISTYPIYFHANHSGDHAHFNKVWSLSGDKAPRTLEGAISTARILVEDANSPQDYAIIYEMRAVHRVGTEYDWKQLQQEESARVREITNKRVPDFRLVATTAQDVVHSSECPQDCCS
jgi:hypothetical protein